MGARRGTPCFWDGVEYPSIAAAARAEGVSPSSMANYIARGFSCRDDAPGVGQARSIPCRFRGADYPSQAAAAAAHEVHPGTVWKHIEAGRFE